MIENGCRKHLPPLSLFVVLLSASSACERHRQPSPSRPTLPVKTINKAAAKPSFSGNTWDLDVRPVSFGRLFLGEAKGVQGEAKLLWGGDDRDPSFLATAQSDDFAAPNAPQGSLMTIGVPGAECKATPRGDVEVLSWAHPSGDAWWQQLEMDSPRLGVDVFESGQKYWTVQLEGCADALWASTTSGLALVLGKPDQPRRNELQNRSDYGAVQEEFAKVRGSGHEAVKQWDTLSGQDHAWSLEVPGMQISVLCSERYWQENNTAARFEFEGFMIEVNGPDGINQHEGMGYCRNPSLLHFPGKRPLLVLATDLGRKVFGVAEGHLKPLDVLSIRAKEAD